MSDSAIESPVAENAVESNGIDGNKTENIETDSSKPVQATDNVLETSSEHKVKAIPASSKSHVDKSSTKASNEHSSGESKSPAKRKVAATEKSSDDEIEDSHSIASPAKKKAKTESHSSDDSGSEGDDAEKRQNSRSKKSKVLSEDEPDDKDDDDEDEEDAEPGLLERPVVLEAGVKREKKKTQRLDITPVMKKVEVVTGEGTKLGDIPGVEFHLAKAHSENLKVLHRVLFERVGSAPVVKKNIRQFCGFAFAEGSAEFKKKHDKLSKLTNPQLKFICEVLNIERGGKKDEIIDRLLHFLLKPHDSGKPVPKSGKKKRRSSSAKKTSSKKSKSDKPKAKKKTKSTDNQSKDDDEESDGENEESEVDDKDESNVESASDSDYEAKKKKKETKKKEKSTPAKKQSKSEKTPKSDAKKSGKKAAGESPKKKATTAKKSKHVTVSSDDSSDEDSEPLQKSSAPTDDVLRNVIKKILKTANLEEVTMKTVCKQVYDKFPEFDLTSRKEFIKTTVKQILK